MSGWAWLGLGTGAAAALLVGVAVLATRDKGDLTVDPTLAPTPSTVEAAKPSAVDQAVKAVGDVIAFVPTKFGFPG